jgi:protein O-GlcNAc transferase
MLLLSALLCAQRDGLDNAWDLAAKGHADEAIRLLHTIIKLEPGNADAHLLLGSLLVESGDKSGAIEQLSEGVHLRPRSAEAQNALGEAYTRFNDPQSARGCFDKALAIDPAFIPANLNLALALLQSAEYDAAEEHLRIVVQARGKAAEAAYAQYLWAKVFTAHDDPKNAAIHLEQAVKLNPEMAEAWSDLGAARKLLLDDSGALAAEKRAVELNASDPVAQYRLGAEYLRQDQLGAAVDHLRAAEKLDPTDQSSLNALQIALRRQGRMQEAEAEKQRLANLLLEKDRASQDSVAAVKLNNDGAALEKAGDFPGALAKYAEALKLYPSHPGIRVNYAVMLLRLGRWTEGLTQLHEAAQRNPNDPKIRAALNDALAQAPPGSIPPGIKSGN